MSGHHDRRLEGNLRWCGHASINLSYMPKSSEHGCLGQYNRTSVLFQLCSTAAEIKFEPVQNERGRFHINNRQQEGMILFRMAEFRDPLNDQQFV